MFCCDYKWVVRIGPTDCLLNIDNVIAFIGKYNGGLPVVGGEEIAPIIKERLFPLFPVNQRVATCDMHPIGQITCVDSYVDIKPFEKITRRMHDLGTIFLSPEAQFTLWDVARELDGNNGSFTVWPRHGLAGTDETNLDPTFAVNDWQFVFPKGMDPTDDCNSAFKSLRGVLTHLHTILRGLGFKRLFLTGLAYDVCVGLSAIDAANLGFDVYVIKEATRAIDIPATDNELGSIEKIEKEFARTDVKVIASIDQLVCL